MVKLLINLLFLLLTSSFAHSQLKDSYLNIKGIKRTFHYHIPQSKKSEMPILIFLHGGGGSGKNFFKLDMSKGIELSDKNDFITVYPDGFKKRWNDGRSVYFSESDDITFLDELINFFIKNFSANPSKVFIAGISNGGFMAYTYAFERPGKIKGIAAVVSGLQKKLLDEKKETLPLNVLIINGDSDPLIPISGGKPKNILLTKRKLGELLSWEETKKFWIKNNFCKNNPHLETIDKDKDDSIYIEHEYYVCQENIKTDFYLLKGAGHTWPGGIQYLPEKIIGKTSKDINATEKIVDFFGLLKN